MIKFMLLEDSYREKWDDWVARCEEGSIFHTWAWMALTEWLRNAKKLHIGIFNGPEMIGIFPLFRARRGVFTLLASPPGEVGYGGPLIRTDYHQEVYQHLDKLLNLFKSDHIRLRLPRESEAKFLSQQDYKIQYLQTVVVNLNQDSDILWRNLKKECRTAVRKAWKNNVQIDEAIDKSFIDSYFEMSQETFGKAGRLPPRSKQVFDLVWDMLQPLDRIKVLLAHYEGKLVAGGIFLRYNQKVYYWDGASSRESFSVCANNLLHWTMIEWGESNGLSEYDMLGANIPSIARFKKSFGGELRPYMEAYKDMSWQATLGRRFYLWLAPRIRSIQFKLQSL